VGDFDEWKKENRDVAGDVETTGEHAHDITLPDINENTDDNGKKIDGIGANLPPYLNVYMWKRIG
jgi:hypothetical protein